MMDKELVKILKALADENRIRILEVIREGKTCVCVIERELKMTQSNVSRHLAKLKNAGVIQAFVRDILTDPTDAAIARTVIALGRSLGLDVIAEGVESQAQRDYLHSIECHAYQGYWFSRPLALAQFETLVCGEQAL